MNEVSEGNSWGSDHPCEVKGCGVKDRDKPMAFMGERWCSDDHRKLLTGED